MLNDLLYTPSKKEEKINWTKPVGCGCSFAVQQISRS